MIFPYLRGVLSFHFAPVTWILLLVNVIIFALVTAPMTSQQRAMEKKFGDKKFLELQGQFFALYISENEKSYSEMTRNLTKLALDGDTSKVELLGGMAIRDKYFMKYGPDFPFRGDKVARKRWMASLEEINKAREKHPSYFMGVSAEHLDGPRWISYQFVHSGFYHLLVNMVFLLIFGCMVEPVMGGLAILLVYLGGGMVAAGAFLLVTGLSPVPLVGASGAVSALIGLFCVVFWRRTVAYFFFLFLPKKGFLGFVYLPAWITFILWMASDLAGFMGTMREFGGVAHSAHIGGQLAGAMVGVGIYFYHRKWGNWKNIESKMPETYPAGHKILLGVSHPPRTSILK